MHVFRTRLIDHHLFLLPFCPQGFCSSSHPIYQRLAIVGVQLGFRAQRLNPEIFEFREDRDHRCIRVAEKDTAADTDEDPAESLENGLAFKVVFQLLPGMPALPIALHSEAPFLALDHEVNPISSYRPLGADAIPSSEQAFKYALLENGIGAPTLLLYRTQQCMWVTGMCNEPPSQVARLEVRLGVK